MARNNPKPTDKLDWISDDTTNILEPLPSKKATGWLFGEKPPNNVWNWITNFLNRKTDYHAAQVEDWIVIDSDADEGDYATLVLWEADAPAAGSRVLVKEDQTVTAQFVLPADVTLKFLDGSRLLCATNIATSVLKLGSNPIIEGVLNIVLSQTGVTAKAVEIDGDNATGKINVENSSTGTLTTGYHINASKAGNRIEGFAQNTGGGTLTNVLVDNSTEDSNNIIIVDEPNNKLTRSRGAYKFRDGLEFDLGSDADGDVYYRDAGILKRLAKGTDDDVLVLQSGIPAWLTSHGVYTPTLTNIANVDASTPRPAFWTRRGNVVTVSGIIDALDITTTGISTQFRITLPVASNLGSFWDLAGNGSSDPITSAIDPMGITGDPTNDEAQFRGVLNGSDVIKQLVSYKFSYEVI